MNGRELFQAIYQGEPVDRFPVQGVWPWAETLERWRGEGLGPDEDPHHALGLVGDDGMFLPLNLNMLPEFEIRVMAEDTDSVTLLDEFGVTKRMLRRDYERTLGHKKAAGLSSSMSEWIDFPVKDLRSWRAIHEERFQPRVAERLPADWGNCKHDLARTASTRWVITACFPFLGLFGPLRELMGLEGLALAMAEDPDLVQTIVQDLCTLCIEVYAVALRDVRVDQIVFFEDMCGTHQPIVGPAMFAEFMAPGYKRITGALREMGVQHFFVDTDGNAWPLIPGMIASGITGLHPCEVNAGMDVGRLRQVFPTLCLDGGIDKRLIACGPGAIEAELERCFGVAWSQGRYTPAPDHGAPPDISWANAHHYADLYRAACAGQQFRPAVAGIAEPENALADRGE